MPIDRLFLQQYIWEHIPIAEAMGLKVEEATTEKVLLSAPLKQNINHKRTAFGGSLHAVATLSCWSLIFIHVREIALPVEIVIAESHIEYLRPVTDDFTAECLFSPLVWPQFDRMLIHKGKARIKLNSKIFQTGSLAVSFSGEFAAVKKDVRHR